MDVNIAYLVLAHNQPFQLKRMVARLHQPNARFYIHIDKKTKDIELFRSALSAFDNVTILSEYNVNWMGYSIVAAELCLMKAAYESGISFKYYVLMSGQDYPIKPNNYINDFFRIHSKDFISYTNLNYMPENMRNKVLQYHYLDIPFMNPRSPQKIPFLVYLYFGSHKYIMKLLPKRRFYKGFEPCFGSQWFALTHDTIKFIINFIKENPGYVKAMKFTQGPDEFFIHTILLNSERKTNLYDYDKYLEWLKTRKDNEVFNAGYTSLRYMDWSERGKSKPAVLDNSYYEILVQSEDLFARKFDETTSAELMDKIDMELLSEK